MRKFNPMRALPGFQAPKTFLSACVMLVSLTATAGVWDEGDIEAGQALFNANCASCHKVTNEVLAAPGLAGIADRWGASEELLVKWIQNPQGAAESGDGYIKSLVDRYVPTYGWMTAQAVSEDDIKNIMAYVQNPPDAAPVAPPAAAPPAAPPASVAIALKPATYLGSGAAATLLAARSRLNLLSRSIIFC